VPGGTAQEIPHFLDPEINQAMLNPIRNDGPNFLGEQSIQATAHLFAKMEMLHRSKWTVLIEENNIIQD
jgi:hypothetical protein